MIDIKILKKNMLLATLLLALAAGTPYTMADDAFDQVTREAEAGNADAQVALGVMYEKGEGVHQDDKKAVDYYRQAAEQGDAAVQYNLGVMYRKGRGVLKDLVRAHMWLNIAAANGDSQARQARDELETLMTASQQQAQQRAQQCLKKHYQGCDR